MSTDDIAGHPQPPPRSSRPVLVFSPQGSERDPSSRIRSYTIARELSSKFPVVTLKVTSDSYNPGRVHLEQLWNTLRLFGIAKRNKGRVVTLLQRGASSLPRVALVLVWRELADERLVFDFDDALFLHSPHLLAMLCRHADCVVVANEYLADYARRCNSHVAIVPTAIDLKLYRNRPRARRDPCVIGWIGSPTNLAYLSTLNDVLLDLKRRIEFTFCVITDVRQRKKIPLDPSLPLEVVDWRYPGFVDDLATFDIGVCPLPDTSWARGKSGYKVLEYMAMGIPAVASGVGEMLHIIHPGKNGFLAYSKADWLKSLLLLGGDGELRTRIGMSGRETVEHEYSQHVAVEGIERIALSLDMTRIR